MKKDTHLSVRISSENLEIIKQKAKQANLSQAEYVTHCCLGQKIVIVNDLKEFLSELKHIGNNLNQAVILSHKGRIDCLNLSEVLDKFKEIIRILKQILEKGESKWQ